MGGWGHSKVVGWRVVGRTVVGLASREVKHETVRLEVAEGCPWEGRESTAAPSPSDAE